MATNATAAYRPMCSLSQPIKGRIIRITMWLVNRRSEKIIRRPHYCARTARAFEDSIKWMIRMLCCPLPRGKEERRREVERSTASLCCTGAATGSLALLVTTGFVVSFLLLRPFDLGCLEFQTWSGLFCFMLRNQLCFGIAITSDHDNCKD